jgi:hypothetical protein
VAEAGDVGLPAAWRGLTLYGCERAWIYAADAREADAAARLVEAAAEDFRARAEREPPARLLVLADGEGWMPHGDPHRRFELRCAGEAILGAAPESGPYSDLAESLSTGSSGGSGARLRSSFRTWEELERAAERAHVEPRVLLAMGAHPIAPASLGAESGLPDGLGGLCDAFVLLPTRACLSAAIEETTDAALRHGASPAKRLLVAPALPFARGKAVDALQAEQKVLLFEIFALRATEWPAEERARRARRYRAELRR